MSHEQVQERTLVLHVMDKDTFSKDDKIGEVQIPLNRMDLSRKVSVWREIGPISHKPGKSPSKSKASSSDEEKKSPRRSTSSTPRGTSSSSGVPMLKYKLQYEHSSRNLIIGVMEAKVINKCLRHSDSILAFIRT